MAALALVLLRGDRDADTAPFARSMAQSTALAPLSSEADQAAMDVAMHSILARPLFDPARHGSAPEAVSQPHSGLPRLSGTLITPATRLAIFAFSDTDKPVAVLEGGRVGVFVVQSIAQGQVVLVGPDGRHSLHTAFSPPNPAPPQEAPK